MAATASQCTAVSDRGAVVTVICVVAFPLTRGREKKQMEEANIWTKRRSERIKGGTVEMCEASHASTVGKDIWSVLDYS